MLFNVYNFNVLKGDLDSSGGDISFHDYDLFSKNHSLFLSLKLPVSLFLKVLLFWLPRNQLTSCLGDHHSITCTEKKWSQEVLSVIQQMSLWGRCYLCTEREALRETLWRNRSKLRGGLHGIGCDALNLFLQFYLSCYYIERFSSIYFWGVRLCVIWMSCVWGGFSFSTFLLYNI